MPKRKLIIFPFNGNGIEALDCIDLNKYELVGFVDDDASKKSDLYDIYSRDLLAKYKELLVLAVPGSPASFRHRKETIASLNIEEGRYITAVHSRASIGRDVQIGFNCLVMAGVVLTSNARINNHVCILPNSVIHHDVVVEDYSLVGSNVVVAGGTTIGKSCYIGSGTNIINGISIGDESLVGLGSNLLRSVTGGARMAGNPAIDLNARSKNEVL
ncbi:DapH/DapD/GlmU-related protein [Pontibacter virosus]|uniref:Sugar O-acyltransferase (Sialic acid O-acetyltransferase NeuD family) n=1 Tax=Pontibacter virosus TaxID=1765052 RepID=A0A2U1AQS8_9BACT|nr:DapH/DapD/GlmU-related protein [Pontibacter virosus]PVY38687.1 sugar O-acyltransferase (sialic acid O-acetyltransferase NeuD family) [Pontibacter virosus]